MSLRSAVAGLSTIGLDELMLVAELQTRIDRKYIVDAATAEAAVTALAPGFAVLEIDGRRDAGYESVYFDTADLMSFHGSAHGRRRRFKVRTRSYVDTGTCMVEIKTVGGRGETVKDRLVYDLDLRAELDPRAREFLAGHGVGDGVLGELRPTLVTSYRRTTLVDDDGARVTLDTGLRCSRPGGASMMLPQRVLIETKAAGHATAMDRHLWSQGIRPIPISKYCTGLAALVPGLASNKWHRTLADHFADPV